MKPNDIHLTAEEFESLLKKAPPVNSPEREQIEGNKTEPASP